MKRFLVRRLAAGWGLSSAAVAQQAPSPYQTRFGVDAPLTLGLAGLSATGLLLTDNRVGYAVGATVGVLIPRLHRPGACG